MSSLRRKLRIIELAERRLEGRCESVKPRYFVRCALVESFRTKLSTGSINHLVPTWLILPAVICLSQRLSHACLSTSRLMVKPRMAHYNSHCLLDLDYPTWITVVILELIHANKLRPYGTSAFIRPKPIGLRPDPLVTLNN